MKKKTATAQNPTTKTDEPQLSPELQEIAHTRAQVLRILDIHAETLARLERKGLGPPRAILPGRVVIYFKDSFHEWLRNREQQPPKRRRVHA